MIQYVVQFDPDTSCIRTGDGSNFVSRGKESQVYQGVYPTVRHIAEVLDSDHVRLNEAVKIQFESTPEITAQDDEWSIDDILRNAG